MVVDLFVAHLWTMPLKPVPLTDPAPSLGTGLSAIRALTADSLRTDSMFHGEGAFLRRLPLISSKRQPLAKEKSGTLIVRPEKRMTQVKDLINPRDLRLRKARIRSFPE